MASTPPPDAAAPIGPEQVSEDQVPWALWTAPAAVGFGLALGYLLVIVVDVIAQAAGSSLSHPTPAVAIIGNVLFDLGFVAAAIYFVRLHGRPRAADFGFRPPTLLDRRRGASPLVAGIAAFLTAGAAYYAFALAYNSALGLHNSEKLPKELGVGKSTAAAIAVTVFVCVLAPMAEEFFFRGFLFGVLRRWRITIAGANAGPWLAAAVVGTLFGIAHTGSASPQYLPQLAVLGFILCLVRWRTGSLYPCMALHSFNNALAMGINQFHWGAGEVLALVVGAMLVIAALTGPLSAPLAVRARA